MEIRKSARAVALFTALTAATSSPLVAVDGVIEINQARALAGGVIPGDDPGFPVTISAGGSFRLTSNLTVDAATTAIEIDASGEVTIDLNGFSIAGPVVCSLFPPTSCAPSGAGIGINGPSSQVRVFNGTVSGMGQYGIYVGTLIAESLHVINNGLSGIDAGVSSVISDSVVERNLTRGIAVISGVVRDCAANHNGLTGIQASTSTVLGSTASENGYSGIDAYGGTVSENVVLGNSGAGINSFGSTIVENTVQNNVGVGLAASPSTGYARNILGGNNGGNANPQVSGSPVQLGGNVCGTTLCP